MDFANKVVLITGASSGIGAACALQFAKASARLVLVGRNVDNLKKVAEQCQLISHLKPLIIIADVSVDKEIERIVENTIQHCDQLDILINNAGMSLLTGIQEGISAYDRIMATNLRGPYLLTSKFIPYLTQTKGNVVNISSSLSTKPKTILMPYCMSKAALDMFNKCVALELGPKGVRVNAVNPGPVRTEIFKRAGMSDHENDKLFAALETISPLKKVSSPEDIAELVVFLASDKASCVTGSCYLIDCGITLGDTENR